MILTQLLVTVGILTSTGATHEAEVPAFKLVVNVANPVISIPKDKVSLFFMGRVTRWENSRSVVPVDQQVKSAVRQRFSQAIHNRSAGAMRHYWQRMVFSGRSTPPVEVENDLEVLEFVRSNVDAIGYVSAPTVLHEGIKVVEVLP